MAFSLENPDFQLDVNDQVEIINRNQGLCSHQEHLLLHRLENLLVVPTYAAMVG